MPRQHEPAGVGAVCTMVRCGAMAGRVVVVRSAVAVMLAVGPRS